jgi:hypothetical protein
MGRMGVPDALGLTVGDWNERLGGYATMAIPERREAVAGHLPRVLHMPLL